LECVESISLSIIYKNHMEIHCTLNFNRSTGCIMSYYIISMKLKEVNKRYSMYVNKYVIGNITAMMDKQISASVCFVGIHTIFNLINKT